MHAAQEEENLTSVRSVRVYMNEWEDRKKNNKWSSGNAKEAKRFFTNIKWVFSLQVQDKYRKNCVSEKES